MTTDYANSARPASGGFTPRYWRLAILFLIPAISAAMLVPFAGTGMTFAEPEIPSTGIDGISTVAVVTDGGTYTELGGASGISVTQIGDRQYALVSANYDDGVQIIDITDPENPSAVTAVRDGSGGFTNLAYAGGITTTQIGDKHYAFVTAHDDHGIQIINITDPENPAPISPDVDDSDYMGIDAARKITTTQIGDRHYALVTEWNESGVRIIDITDPENPSSTAIIVDDASTALDGADRIIVTQIGDRHYALVTALYDDGVQIIDITDPSSPSAVAAVTDGGTYTALDGANGIAVTQIGDRHYALATAVHEHGVQIIDITDPSSPSAVAAVTDGDTYTELYGAAGITTVQTGDMHYALVASYYGWGGVQIINITDPSSPSAVDSLDGESFTRLFTGAYEITTVQTGDTYHALVVATRAGSVHVLDTGLTTGTSGNTQPDAEPYRTFCDGLGLEQLLADPAYNTIDNRGGASPGNLVGTSGADLILASPNGDTIRGKGGDDCIIGGAGSDTIRGGAGSDTIYGGAGSDAIYGGKDNDAIYGGTGSDNIWGNGGNDILHCGPDKDVANGGPGTDAVKDCEKTRQAERQLP